MRVGIIGLGLIGGSLGLALRAAGWHVRGWDVDPHVGQRRGVWRSRYPQF